MSGAVLLLVSAGAFALGYAVYLKFLIKKFFILKSENTTPANEINDGFDYVPARNWLVLFGHHFASIAGAAPIIGPVIAVSLWGWIPALIWIIFGSIFLGGVHDFASLYISMKSRGVSISEIAAFSISQKTRNLFSIFILLTLILIIAVFLYFCADTMVSQPKVVIPSLGLIPVAVFVGIMLYRFKFSTLAVTIFGIVAMLGLIFLGDSIDLNLTVNKEFWIVVLMFYCFLASSMPVNILLQPRDYLATYLLFGGVLFGIAGIFIKRPVLEAQHFVAFAGREGFVWPMLFVTIACGAISGFHSLVATGTTSKQISSESHAPRIGYGGMLLEGLVAVIALIAVSSLSKADFSSSMNNYGAVGCFGRGFGYLASPFLGGYGEPFAVLVLNAFILTTLDTATRISRYVMAEVFNFKGRLIPALGPVILAGLLAISGRWRSIWIIFGAGNQLIAALSLIVIAGWLIKNKKNIICVFVPALFMLITTISAIVYKLGDFIREGNIVLSIISIMLILLGFSVFWEARFIFKNRSVQVG